MGRLSEALDKAGYVDGLEKGRSKKEVKMAENQPPVPDEEVVKKESVKPTLTVSHSQKNLSSKWDERLLRAVNNEPVMSEMFKKLRSRILYHADGLEHPKTIMITSATPDEGKSFVSANLGISFAQGLDQYCLLVDCDLRTPSQARLFGLPGENGLVNFLRDSVGLEQLIKKTSIKKLSILPGGVAPVNPAELLSSVKMGRVVEELSMRYDDRIILFDTPPVLVAAESTVLSEHVDGVILVVRQNKSGRAQVKKIVDLIGQEKIIGVVFNDYSLNYFEKNIIKDQEHLCQEYY